MSPEDFARLTKVSRETLERLRLYEALLHKWQKRVNLVGAATLPDLWERHFFDSAQLIPLLSPTDNRIVDLGSGAGFPGMVLALLLRRDVILIEANQKKSAFLREVARQTEAQVTIINERIETITPIGAELITARALAPLPQLLALARLHLRLSGRAIFLKGKNIADELTLAKKQWMMTYDLIQSRASPHGRILIVRRLLEKNAF